VAYEIISQNNTTTTLSDGTNTITVPARVTLATSTSYTISEVNNNTATLEGSDGSVIRDVPCVVVLAGESGGGSDVHNKGYFATQAALEEAYPTGEAGDYAIVGATDTLWIWDEDSSAWVDTDTKGQVTSVNGQTGDVVLDLLPSQTGQSGKFLTTDGTDASWSDKPLVNTATQPGSGALGISATVTGYEALGIKTLKGQGTRSITIGNGSETQSGTESEMAIGRTAKAYGSYACAIGNQANAYGANCHAIGYNATAGDYRYYSTYGAWQFGSGTNNEAGTVCFALTTSNDYQHWTNYKLLDSDGTIPEARLADTTNATTGDVLTLDSNGNAVWQAGGGGGGSTALSLTLAAANWSNNTITVTATGVTASNNVIVSPAPASQSAYTTAGVMCTTQAADSLTFTCTATPSSDLTVTVLII
jgi:hypothetical protein